MTTIIIHVTRDDIDRGRQGDCKSCPVALALRRAVRCDFAVGDQLVSFYPEEGGLFHRPLPPNVVDHINVFDVCGEMHPFSFALDLPETLTAEEPPCQPDPIVTHPPSSSTPAGATPTAT